MMNCFKHYNCVHDVLCGGVSVQDYGSVTDRRYLHAEE